MSGFGVMAAGAAPAAEAAADEPPVVPREAVRRAMAAFVTPDTRRGLVAVAIDTALYLVALAFGIFMFSLAGIPPLAGFFGKLYVFLAAVQSGMWALAIIGVLTSVVGSYYYLRIVKVMYFDAPAPAFDRRPSMIGFVAAVTGLFTLFFFLFPGPLVAAAGTAASALFG